MPLKDDRLAANGRPACENFARWFDVSQVVDAHGLPLVVFHGTRTARTGQGIEAFRPATWFAQDVKLAEKFYSGSRGNIQGNRTLYPVFLSIKSPLDIRTFDIYQPITGPDLAKILGLTMPAYRSHLYKAGKPMLDESERLHPALGRPSLDEQGGIAWFKSAASAPGQDLTAGSPMRLWEVMRSRLIQSLLTDLGYDGVRAREELRASTPKGCATESDTWMTFHSAQVKSAIGNSGLYLKDDHTLSDFNADLVLLQARKAHLAIEKCMSNSKIPRL